MDKSENTSGLWRPRPGADASAEWNTQLAELRAHEEEVTARIDALESGRGALLVSGTPEEVTKAETALALARAEAERIPVMRAEITVRRDKAAGREEIAKFETERQRLKSEVAIIVTEIQSLDEMLAPFIALVQREREAHSAIESFNRRYREMATRRGIERENDLQAPVDIYAASSNRFPVWRVTHIPSPDGSGWLWKAVSRSRYEEY